MEDIKQYADLGITAVICITFILTAGQCFKFWLENKKKPSGSGFDRKIYDELSLMNGNHLTTLQTTIVENNEELIKTITDGNTKMIEILARIDGRLSSNK